MKNYILCLLLWGLTLNLTVARPLATNDIASLSAIQTTICTGASTVLTASGTLNLGSNWYWYTTNCGATAVGTGAMITVSPTSTTTYYCRAENPSTSFVGSNCANISITVNASLTGPSLSTSITPSASVCTGTAVTIGGTSTSTSANTDLTFDGVDDYIDLGNMTVLNGASAFSFEAKVFSTSNTGFRTIFAKRVNDDNCIQLQYAQGQAGGANSLMFKVTGGAFNAYGYTDGNAFSLNAWHHVVAVFDGSGATNADRLKLYIDGFNAPLTFVNNIPAMTVTNSNPMLIGSEGINAFSLIAFEGKMEDVRIWSTARSAAQVAATQSNCITGSEAGLLVEYKFNEGSGATAMNTAAGGGYAGAMNNFTLASCRNANATGCSGGGGSSSNTVTWSGGISNNTSFVPNNSTNYIATATAPNNCVSNANVSVTVNPLPVIAINAVPSTTVCSGDNLTLSGNAGAVAASWSGGITNNVAFVPVSSGIYTASLTDANGCSSSTNVNITVNPSVSISAPTAATICDGQNTNFAIAATNATNYQWQENPNTGIFSNISNGGIYSGANSPTLNLTAANLNNHNYSYRCVASGLCSATSTVANLTVQALPPAPNISATATSVCAGTPVTLTAVISSGYTGTEYLWHKNGNPVNYVNGGTGTYTVSTLNGGTDIYQLQVVTTNNNCLSPISNPLSIVKHDPMAVITPAGPTTFCANIPTVLNANTGMSSYLWKKGASIVNVGGLFYTPTSSGNYNVKVTDMYGCSKTSAWTTITVNPQPIANAGIDKSVCLGQGVQIGVNSVNNIQYAWSPATGLSNPNISNPIAAPITTINYTLTATNISTGCSKTDAVLVTRLVLPTTPTLNNTATPVCQGSTVSLTPTNLGLVSSVNWYKNGVLMFNKPVSYTQVVSTPTNTTDVYTIRTIGNNGCLSSASNFKNIWVKPAAIPTISSNAMMNGNTTTVCVANATNGSAVLTANTTTSGATYSWLNAGNFIPNANTNTYTANVGMFNNNQIFAVKATYTNGCTKTSNNHIVSFSNTGCESRIHANKDNADAMLVTNIDIKTYPNPVSEELYIQISNANVEQNNIALINNLGQIVFSKELNFSDGKAELTIDMRAFSSGVYMLSLSNYTHKIIKN